MSIEVHVPTVLHPYTAGRRIVEGTGATFPDLLNDLERRHPGLRDRVLTPDGTLRRLVRVHVNDDAEPLREPAAELADGDTVTLRSAVEGGALGFAAAAALFGSLVRTPIGSS